MVPGSPFRELLVAFGWRKTPHEAVSFYPRSNFKLRTPHSAVPSIA